jgi:hypothetical protein
MDKAAAMSYRRSQTFVKAQHATKNRVAIRM